MKREKHYGVSPWALKLLFIISIIAILVELLYTEDKWNTGPKEVLPDYSVVLSETKTAEHNILVNEDVPLQTAIIDGKSYYVFRIIEGNNVSDTLYIPEDNASVVLTDGDSFAEIYERETEYYIYSKYRGEYKTNTDNSFAYVLYINNDNITHLGSLSSKQYFGISVWPYFFTMYR